MKKKPGLTIDQHKELGEKFFQIREELIQVSTLLYSAYPASKINRIGRIIDNLDKIRADLDFLLFKDCPGKAVVSIYYPGAKDCIKGNLMDCPEEFLKKKEANELPK